MLNADMFSELKPYSLGMVAENKKLKGADGQLNHTVEVTPIEDLPMLDGEVKSGIVTDSVSYQDATGGNHQLSVTTANSISAVWLPFGSSNRFSSPDVRRGAIVMLWRFSDEDRFFWTTLKDDLHLRKLETVIYAWSGTQDESAKVGADNYYYLEVSTHRGVVNFHTSKANGEFSAIDIQINAKDGVFQFMDDTGHLWIMDFKEKQMAMTNPDGTSIEINKKNLTIIVPETYKLVAKNKVEEVGETVQIKAGTSIEETTPSLTFSADSSLTAKTGSYSLTASGSITEKAGGAVTIHGSGVKIGDGVALT